MQTALIFLSSILWGVTNPFLRKASIGLEAIQAKSFLAQTILQLKFLFTNLNVTVLNISIAILNCQIDWLEFLKENNFLEI